MPKPMLLQLNSLAIAAFVFMIIAVPPAFAQEMDGMEMNQTAVTATEPPVVMTTDDGKINVKLSWEPQTIDVTDQPTIFTLEFLDADTEQRISDVTYSVHMALDGKSLGHGHEASVADGVATTEQRFNSVGTLDMVIEIHKIGSEDASQFTRFSVAVTPELPAAVIALAAGFAAVAGLSILKRSLL